MMRWIAVFAFTLLHVGHACAQQRNAHWPIPPGSWLHFDADGTQVEPWATSSIYNYQSASISSPTGALQLYNDQHGIYNAHDDTLIAGSFPAQIVTAGQGWLYCPRPGDSDRIAGFGMRRDASNILGAELKSYSFQRDLGTDLWQLEAGGTQVLIDSTAWKLTAVAHANGVDYWIITHLHSSDTFAAFRLSATGVDPVPVISHTGFYMPIESGGCCEIALTGSLVASYDGTQLSLSVRPHGSSFGNILYSMLYHFDTSTGVVTANTILPGIPLTVRYGTEFSMDGTKLYQLHANYNGDGDTPASITLRQYELSSQDPAQIAESAVVIHLESGLLFEFELFVSNALNMATGPDGRIYMLWRNNGSLSVINEPNAAGAACNFVVEQVQLPDTLANTLPNQCKRYHDSELSVGVPAMRPEAVELEVWPVPTEGLVHVRSRNAGPLLVVDALGRTVFSRSIGKNTTLPVDLSRSAAGAYAVHLLAPGAAPVHRMIIKR